MAPQTLASRNNINPVQRLEEQLNKEMNMKAGFERLIQAMAAQSDTRNRQEMETQLIQTNQRISGLERELGDARKVAQQKANSDIMTKAWRSSEFFGGENSSPNSPESKRRNGGRTEGSLRLSISQNGSPLSGSLTTDQLRLLKSKLLECLDKLLNCLEPAPTRKIVLESLLINYIKPRLDLSQFIEISDLIKVFRVCLSDGSRDVRITTLRVIKYFAWSLEHIKALMDHHLDIFLIRILTRDIRTDTERGERDQCLRAIRTFVDAPKGCKYLSQGIVRTLVAIADQKEDRISLIALETLCEIALRNPELVATCGGIRIIFESLLETSRGMDESLLMTVLYLLDTEQTRCFLRPNVELETLISALTDTYTKGTDEKLYTCARATRWLFRSWTGFIYLCQDNRKAIVSIVDALKLSNDDMRKTLLQMISDIFRIDLPKWYPDFVMARGSNVINVYASQDTELRDLPPRSPLPSDRLNLINHYMSILLMAFVDSGLLEALEHVVQNSNKYVAVRTAILVGELLEMVSQLLPTAYGVKVQTLSSLFTIASNFRDEPLRHVATSALTHIENLHKNKENMVSRIHEVDPASARWLSTSMHQSRGDRMGRMRRQVEDVKFKIGLQIDDKQFYSLLDGSLVTQIKIFTQWNWDSIMELLHGPLLNQKRLEEALNPKYKFVKRLLSFLRPTNGQFANIKKTRGSTKYTKAALELIKVLLNSAEGTRFLAENLLLPQISEGLAQLDKSFHVASLDVLFSPERIRDTLIGDYFVILGALGKSDDGMRLLERNQIFTLMFRLVDRLVENVENATLSGEALVEFIRHQDYNSDGPARALLSAVLGISIPSSLSASKQSKTNDSDSNVDSKISLMVSLKLEVLTHLRYLLRSSAKGFSEWGIRILAQHLYDPRPEMCEKTIEILDEACNDSRCLETLVSLRPDSQRLTGFGSAILFRCVSSSAGFEYLNRTGYVEREIDDWYENANFSYVTKVELCLAHLLSSGANSIEEPNQDGDRIAPPVSERQITSQEISTLSLAPLHFYGELCKTSAGCALLKRKGHINRFLEILRKPQSQDNKSILRLKAILWALGHVGSTRAGLTYLQEEGIVKDIVAFSQNTTCLSIKGTCYYVFGLISKTPQGVQILQDYRWETVSHHPFGTLNGLCVPQNLDSFLRIATWNFRGSWPDQQIRLKFIHKQYDFVELEILKSIGSMSNHIVANAASKSLSRLRHEKPQYFVNMELYLDVMRVLSIYHYKLAARRFTHDLFDRLQLSAENLQIMDERGGLKALNVARTNDGVGTLSLEEVVKRNKVWNEAFNGPPNDLIIKPLKKKEENKDATSSSMVGAEAGPKAVLLPRVIKKGFP